MLSRVLKAISCLLHFKSGSVSILGFSRFYLTLSFLSLLPTYTVLGCDDHIGKLKFQQGDN